ncbi:MAG TPA: hypothetical protein VHC69_34680 [Polyangiaceae bacterium]|nr:hypothetical protein [Polyangiaceae bacterium]
MTVLDIDSALYEPRTPIRAYFHDKLAPAQRWMRSQVGRPWDKVRGELMLRFDTRTTAGRHIVFDHLLQSVQIDETATRFWPFDFKVDRYGILRELTRTRYRRPVSHPALPEPESMLLDWMDRRRVGERDTHLYWFVPTPAGAFRQASPLDETDAARWRSLPIWFRERWDAFAAPPPERSI